MKENVDPKSFGLPSRTVLRKKGSEEFILVMNRKSRIIMKNVQIILKKVNIIKEKIPKASVSLETSAPVCSKSIQFLKDNGIKILKI